MIEQSGDDELNLDIDWMSGKSRPKKREADQPERLAIEVGVVSSIALTT